MEEDNRGSNAKCEVCKSKASFKCSRCKLVYYCSKDHQKSHWKQHKFRCRNYDVRTNGELGRYLISDRDLEGGRVVVEELPLVVGPRREPCCLGCLGPLPSVRPTCPACHWPICSNQCNGILTNHLTECLVLRLNTTPANTLDLRYEAILPLRCLILQKTSPRRWQQLMSMQSHTQLRELDKESFLDEEERIVKYLRENYLSKVTTLDDTSSNVLHTICGIIEVNALEISLGGCEAQGLYPTFCLMEHSCVPNTRHTFRDADFRITATTSSFVKKGEHLSTMYSNTLWGTTARREELRATKYFSCACSRCVDPRELATDFSTLICLNQPDNQAKSCGGDMVAVDPLDDRTDWKCVRCHALLSGESVQTLMTDLSQQIDQAMQRATVTKLEALLWKLEQLVHKNHYHCFTVKHTLVQLYGREKCFILTDLTDKQLQRKIELCEELQSVTSKLDPGGGRLAVYTGVILYELSSAWRERSRRGQHTQDKGKQYLLQCAQVLSGEPTGSPGSNLLQLVNAELPSLLTT